MQEEYVQIVEKGEAGAAAKVQPAVKKAEAAVVDSPAVKELESKVAEAKAKVAELVKRGEPKAMSEKELEELFAKSNKTRDEVIKEGLEKYGNDIKKLWEGTPKGGKMALVIGAGAAAGLILGAIFAPKHKNA